MRIATTYFIKYDGGTKAAWLAEGVDPSTFPDVTYIEERPVLKADEGKTLWRINDPEAEKPYEVGESVWLRDTTQADYEERDKEEPQDISDAPEAAELGDGGAED